MFVGGSIGMRIQREINSADWEYQLTDTKWSTYPKSISLLIERQKQNSQTTPIYYQLSNGNKYKIHHLNSLQFDLQNNSVVMIRRSDKSKTEKLNYNKCPKCLFKIGLNAKICKICDTNIHQQLLKQYNNSQNNNNKNNNIIKPKQEQKIEPIKQEQKLEPMPKEEKVENIKHESALQHDELLCPFCKAKNKIGFNFCVGCGFDLRDYEKPKPKKENENENDVNMVNNDNNNNNNNNNGNDIDMNDNNNNNNDNNEPGVEPGSPNNPDIIDNKNDDIMNDVVIVPDNNIFNPNDDDDDDDDDVVLNEPEGPGQPNENNNNNKEKLEFAQDWH